MLQSFEVMICSSNITEWTNPCDDDDYCIDAVTAHVAASTVSTFVTSGPNKLVEEKWRRDDNNVKNCSKCLTCLI